MSATNRGAKRADGDFYETPGWVTRAIIPHLKSVGLLANGQRVLEPAAGNGAIVRELISCGVTEENISSYEIDAERACASGARCDDFLLIDDIHTPFDLIITNPPYSLAMKFAQQGMRMLSPWGAMVMLTRINWLASQRRAAWLRENTPSLFVLPKRPSFTGKGTDATDYAWLMWRKPSNGRKLTPLVRILEVE